MSYKYNHVFGPVPSRRLGVSLGVDVVPYKICSYDCVYCECGVNTKLTMKRDRYVDYNEIIYELDLALKKDVEKKINYITLTGSGEPTLSIDIGKIVRYLKEYYPKYKISLITNSSLLWNTDVQDEILDIDCILPSLDAVSEDVFFKLNRPVEVDSLNKIIEGIYSFKKRFKGKLWVEIFVIPGLNDTDEELILFKKVLNYISPDEIHLNTLDRPGLKSWIKPASKELLTRIKKSLGLQNIKILKDFSKIKSNENNLCMDYDKEIEHKILSILKRRPCTMEDLRNVLELDVLKVNKYINNLAKYHPIKEKIMVRGKFYTYENK